VGFIGDLFSGIGKFQYEAGIPGKLADAYSKKQWYGLRQAQEKAQLDALLAKNAMILPMIQEYIAAGQSGFKPNAQYDPAYSEQYYNDAFAPKPQQSITDKIMSNLQMGLQGGQQDYTFNNDYTKVGPEVPNWKYQQNKSAGEMLQDKVSDPRLQKEKYQPGMSRAERARNFPEALALAGLKDNEIKLAMLDIADRLKAAQVENKLALGPKDAGDLLAKFIQTGNVEGTDNNTLVTSGNMLPGMVPFNMAPTQGTRRQLNNARIANIENTISNRDTTTGARVGKLAAGGGRGRTASENKYWANYELKNLRHDEGTIEELEERLAAGETLTPNETARLNKARRNVQAYREWTGEAQEEQAHKLYNEERERETDDMTTWGGSAGTARPQSSTGPVERSEGDKMGIPREKYERLKQLMMAPPYNMTEQEADEEIFRNAYIMP
jgi:hypothetical protein